MSYPMLCDKDAFFSVIIVIESTGYILTTNEKKENGKKTNLSPGFLPCRKSLRTEEHDWNAIVV